MSRKNNNKVTKETSMHYTRKFWCVITIFIALIIIVVVGVLFRKLIKRSALTISKKMEDEMIIYR